MMGVVLILLPLLIVSPVFGEELKVLESQLNKNSITGVIQNPYNYTIGAIQMRAEFYDKEDGHLVGLRDFYEVSRDELQPNEKSSFKIYEHAGETTEFPKTDFIVKAEGIDYTGMEEISQEELISDIEGIGNALKALPNEVIIDVTELENGTKEIAGKTIIYENGTKKIVNETGTYKITTDDKP